MLPRQEAVVHQAILLDREARVAALEIAGAIAGDAMAQRQVLGARRGADRVGLDEAELFDRSEEGGGLEQGPRHRISAQIVEAGRLGHPQMMPRRRLQSAPKGARAMSKPGKVVLTVLLLAGFGAALFFALRGQKVEEEQKAEAAAIASATELKGLIALDVEPFFADARVKRILVEKRLPVAVTRIGSREMAARVVPGAMPDFFFPSGVVAANQIADAAAKAKIPVAQSSPFFSPMVIASWQPVAKILVANGMAKPLGDRTYGVDIGKLTETMLARKRWKDLKGAEAYDVSRACSSRPPTSGAATRRRCTWR
jgi:hypothetical protein